MPTYTWNAEQRRYRDSATGRFVRPETVRASVRTIIERSNAQSDTLADLLANGQLSPADWEREFRETLKRRSISTYMLGRGGQNVMEARDYGRVGAHLRGEYKLLRKFRQAVDAGELSDAQIRARSRQYFNSTQVLYEKGNAGAYGISLPVYPGERSECQNGCKCRWDIRPANLGNPEREDWDAFWRLGQSEHCPQCERRAQVWAPLQYRNGKPASYPKAGLFT